VLGQQLSWLDLARSAATLRFSAAPQLAAEIRPLSSDERSLVSSSIRSRRSSAWRQISSHRSSSVRTVLFQWDQSLAATQESEPRYSLRRCSGCAMRPEDFRTANMQAHVCFYAFQDCDRRSMCPLFARAPEHSHGWESGSSGKHVSRLHRWPLKLHDDRSSEQARLGATLLGILRCPAPTVRVELRNESLAHPGCLQD